MTNAITLSKKAFTWAVVLMTIAWSVGLAALAPAAVLAVECPDLDPGTDFKTTSSNAVWHIDQNLEKLGYPQAFNYLQYHADFSGVVEVPGACFDNYPDSDQGFVTYFPGTLYKQVESPRVYVVGMNNKAYPIESAEVAAAYFGANWASRVRDVLAAYAQNLDKQGTFFDGTAPLDGMLVRHGGNVYQMMGGMLKMVEGDLPAGALAVAINATDEQWAAWEEAGAVSEETVTASSVTANPAQTMLGGSGEEPEENPEETPAAEGDLHLSLSGTNPASRTFPINVDNVFTKVVFDASDSEEDVTVKTVRIGRSGLGSTSDFTGVTLYDGAQKLGSTRSSWTSDNIMNYNLGSGWVIPAGTKKTLTIKGTVSAAGTYNALGIVSVSADNASPTGVPVFGNEMLSVDVTVGNVTVSGRGVGAQSRNIGVNNTVLAELRFELNNVERGLFQSLSLENRGTADNDDLANLALYHLGEKIAGPAMINANDQVTFVLDSAMDLEKNRNYDFQVRGDIVDGPAKTVAFVLDSTSDLVVVGSQYNANMRVTNQVTSTGSSGVNVTTIDGAELNLAFTSEAQDTRDDVDNVIFGTLTLSAGATDVEIDTLKLNVEETNGDSDATNNKDLDDVELYNPADGSTYSGTRVGDVDDNNADTGVYTFEDLYLEAGVPQHLQFRADIPDGVGEGDAYRVSMTVNGTNVVAQTKPANDTVSEFSIGSFTGQYVTIEAPKLTIRSTNLSDEDAVESDEMVLLFQGTWEASAACDVRVTQMQFNGAHVDAANTTSVANNFDEDNWSQVGLYVWDAGSESWVPAGGDSVYGNNELGDGLVNFSSLDHTVKAGSANKVTFGLFGNVESTLSANTTVHVQAQTMTARTSAECGAESTSIILSTGYTLASQRLETQRDVVLRTGGSLKLSMRPTDTGFNKDRVLLAGNSAWVGKIRLRAEYEAIRLRDLKLANSNSSADDSAVEVCLYSAPDSAAENRVACTELDGGVAFFNDMTTANGAPVVLDEGTHDWYIYVRSTNVGSDGAATADTGDIFKFRLTSSTGTGVDAVGVRSGDELSFGDGDSTVEAGEIAFDHDGDGTFDEGSGTEVSEYSKEFIVAASKINDVSFVSSYGGETVDTQITAASRQYTLAILKIENAQNSNNDSNGDPVKLVLEQLVINGEKTGTTTLSSLTIERINGVTGSLAFDSTTGAGTAASTTFTLTVSPSSSDALGVDAKIERNVTAYYVIKGTIATLDTATGVADSVTLRLNSLNGGSGTNNIDWYDGSSTGTKFEYLRLDKTSLSGTPISENNIGLLSL